MDIRYPAVGICGLSCRLCPMYQTEAASKCLGCKSPARIAVGCPFITCALKNRGVEFCWDCPEHASCEKWQKHRDIGREHDSFKCYQTLEADIRFIQENGVAAFDDEQQVRESILRLLLGEFNEGRSRTYYCIAATVMDIDELQNALEEAAARSRSLDAKGRAKLMHSLLDNIAQRRGYYLKLRK